MRRSRKQAYQVYQELEITDLASEGMGVARKEGISRDEQIRRECSIKYDTTEGLGGYGGLWGSYKDAVVNYEDTLGALKQVGKGAMSQLAGAVGVEQDPVKKAENERLIKALEDHWKAYGSVKGIKKALATDPFGTLTDVSSLFGGAGLVGKTAGLSKAAKIASAASAMTDPVQLALKGAGLVSRKAANVPLFAQSVTSGASMGALRDAARAGANPEMSKVFTTHLTDASKHTDVIDAVEQALKKKADERSSAYVASQNEIFGGNPPNLDWSPIDSSLNSSLNSVTNKRTGQVIYNNAAHALSDMKTAINDWKSAGASTIEDFDDLKKKICIFTDSQYCIYIMTGTGERYEKNGFKQNGKSVPNIDLIKKALEIIRKYNA
jgi:hypothetical protein